MKDQSYKYDVPATPTGVMFHETPMCYQVEHFAIGLENPIHDDDIESLKSFFSASIMLKIPRFSCLLVKHPNGKHYWRSTKVDIDDHFITRRLINDEIPNTDGSKYEDLINGYIAELATMPTMSTDKPLWEIHALVDVRCVVLRIHHAIGDGTSLAWLIREIGSSTGGPRRHEEKRKVVNGVSTKSTKEHWRWNKGEGLLGFVRYAWFSSVFGLDSVVNLLVKDKTTVLKGTSEYSYYRQQKLATARFSLDDVNLVKNAIPNATLNDVICGIIWGGFMKYIDARSSSGDGVTPKEGQQITGILIANVRRVSRLQELSTEGKSFERWWGNKIGSFFMPMHYTKKAEHVLSYVNKSKSILDKKKHSAEPRFSFLFCKMLFRLFGVEVANYIINKAAANATFEFSNVMGPSEQIYIAGNPVTYLNLSVSSLPLGIVMHLLSYMKDLNLQILVAEDVIPDPKFLGSCFEQTLRQMMDALTEGTKV